MEAILDGFRNLGNFSSPSIINPSVENSPADEVSVTPEPEPENSLGSGTPEINGEGEGHGDSETDEPVILQDTAGIPSITGTDSEPITSEPDDDSDGLSERIGLTF